LLSYETLLLCASDPLETGLSHGRTLKILKKAGEREGQIGSWIFTVEHWPAVLLEGILCGFCFVSFRDCS